MAEQEQNKTEDATPFKLERARREGNVARGADLGFMSALFALCLFGAAAGSTSLDRVGEAMRRLYATAIPRGADAVAVVGAMSDSVPPYLQIVALFGATVALIVLFFEVVQIRGPLFALKALKPDFNRLNPAKGFKRVFSRRTVKSAVMNIVKLVTYSGAALLVLAHVFRAYGDGMSDAAEVRTALGASASRLVYSATALAIIFAIIDQVLSRAEFKRMMRMSRSELEREIKDREGEPRLKAKRKQLHREFASQASGVRGLAGSDMLIVNPEHFAVALRYDAKEMSAPAVAAKGRNRFALMLKARAGALGIPIIENPALARALFRSTAVGREIPGGHYHAVAELYLAKASGGTPAV